MRIAIPHKDGQIAEVFETAAAFKLFNLENGEIVSSVALPAFGTGGEAMAEFLKAARADVLVCGGITARTRQLVAASGLAVYPGFGGSADDAARAFASGGLKHDDGHDCANCKQDCAHHSHDHAHSHH